MPDIEPFRAWRYNLGHIGELSDVVAPPYDVIDDELRDALYKRHPCNVIRLILNREEPGDDDARNRYTRAARFLRQWREEQVLFEEGEPALYVYHQEFTVEGQVYTRRHLLARMRLENDLRRALEQQEFELYYQPIVDLGSGRIAGFEALCRWRHPEQGMVSPELFIPLAESTGLIIPLGLWVLRQAMAQICDWHRRFPAEVELGMSVNLSGKQFAQKDLVEEIGRTLAESGVNRRSLKLEITESAIMNDADSASVLLDRLKALDIQLSIDDFGTGYSSLSYLHRFPFDILKVDRSFVGKLDQDRQGLEIVRTIIALAQVLELKVVAEGIETPNQLALLRKLGCHYGQGYWFATPLPAAEAQALLARAPTW